MPGTSAKPEFRNWGEFQTPFYLSQYPQPEFLNDELRKLILQQATEGDRYANPRVSSNQVEIFESHFDWFKDPAPCVKELRKFFLFGVMHAARHANDYTLDQCKKLQVMTDAWFHVTRFGGYISTHNHPNASWSAVYMVDAGEQPPDLPKGGVLSFKDPRMNANMHHDPGNDHWIRSFHLGSVNQELKPGELLVFPSFIQHEVTPYFGSKPRISVAANCHFTLI